MILATISIQALTNTGLFKNANKAKLETKRSQIKEWLSLNLMEVQTTNYNKTDSEILEIARGKAEKSEELKKLGKTVNVDGEISTEEDGQTVPPYFDVIVDNDMYKVSMEEQEFIGEVGKIVPSVDFSATTSSKSITLKITTKRNQGGTVECYIKGENDSNYGTAQKATDNQYKFDNLEQGKKYTVKVVVTSGNGQKAEKEKEAKAVLIEHNLRLVVYIAKKFDNTGVSVEDLISIGTIGLIKAINTFNPVKNIKLATYASRCIENEILMYLRRNSKTKMEVSIDEPLNVDWDGNELLLSDILGTDDDVISRRLEDEVEIALLGKAISKLTKREQMIIRLRFGIGNREGMEKTQKEVADLLGISQSYISRLEKRIMKRLRKEIVKYE